MESKTGFIKLNTIDDCHLIYVNVNHIILFGPIIDDEDPEGEENGSYINIIEFNKPIKVYETPKEIFNLL
jgi:hypothetical protein